MVLCHLLFLKLANCFSIFLSIFLSFLQMSGIFLNDNAEAAEEMFLELSKEKSSQLALEERIMDLSFIFKETIRTIQSKIYEHEHISSSALEEEIRALSTKWENTLNEMRSSYFKLPEKYRKIFDRFYQFAKYMDVNNDEECFCEQCLVNMDIIDMNKNAKKFFNDLATRYTNQDNEVNEPIFAFEEDEEGYEDDEDYIDQELERRRDAFYRVRAYKANRESTTASTF